MVTLTPFYPKTENSVSYHLAILLGGGGGGVKKDPVVMYSCERPLNIARLSFTTPKGR